MRTISLSIALITVMVGASLSQPAPEPEYLGQAMDDLNYAQLLSGAQLTPDQLEALLGMQATWQGEATLTPEVAAALLEVRTLVLEGMSVEEAFQSLGDDQRAVRDAQLRLEQALQTLSEQFATLLTDEQRSALVWLSSPPHALDNVVRTVERTRAVPDEQWAQFRAELMQNVARHCAQADPAAGTTPEDVAALLDGARAMSDADFRAQRATLAGQWAAVLLPNFMQRLQDEDFRRDRLAAVARHLISYPRGYAIVEAKLAALQAP
ncbi:MAG: hypothetical protein ACE5R4_10840 [Armatimonadota bacterium]